MDLGTLLGVIACLAIGLGIPLWAWMRFWTPIVEAALRDLGAWRADLRRREHEARERRRWEEAGCWRGLPSEEDARDRRRSTQAKIARSARRRYLQDFKP